MAETTAVPPGGCTIMDMPTEILTLIFQNFVFDIPPWTAFFGNRVTTGYREHTDRRTLNAVRLTCRAFSATADLVAIPHVRVDVSTASLARLDSISRHPRLRLGVRCLHVCTAVCLPFQDDFRRIRHIYREEMDSNLPENATASPRTRPARPSWVRGLQGIWFLKHNEDWEWLVSEVRLTKMMNELGAEFFADGLPHMPTREASQDEFEEVLKEVTLRYRNLTCDQQSLLENGAFVRTLAEIMTRLPQATRLDLDDGTALLSLWEKYRIVRWWAGAGVIESENLFRQDRLAPQLQDGDQHGAVLATNLSAEILAALHRAGVPPLKKLHLASTFYWGEDFFTTRGGDGDACLARVLGGLETLGVWFADGVSVLASPSALEAMRDDKETRQYEQFLHRLTRSPVLRRVEFDMRGLAHYLKIDLGRALAPQGSPRPPLRHISAESMQLNVAGLGGALGGEGAENAEKLSLRLTNISVTGGLWETVLDVVRERGLRNVVIDGPRGGEIGALSRGEYKSIFTGPHPDRIPIFRRYALGTSDVNPLRALREARAVSGGG